MGNETYMSLLTFPNSGNTYYFRSRIPFDLIEHFGGLKEFRISLKCAIKSRSIRTTKILDQKVSGIYEEIRQGMKSLEIDDIKEILRIEIRKQILHTHHVYEGTNRWSDTGVEKSLETTEKKDSNLREILKDDLKSYLKQVDSKIRLDLFPELSDSLELTEMLLKDQPPNISTTPTISNNLPYLPIAGGLLSSNAKTFFERKRIEKKSSKEIESDRKIVEEFIEIVGDIDFSSVTKKEVSFYIDIQTKLPPNRKKNPKYRDLTIKEVIELNLSEKEVQTPQNINKRITKLSVFGNWGVRQGFLITNPFSGMEVSVKKQPHTRQPFTTDELRKILKPETYFKWTIHFSHHYRKDRVSNHLPYYWIFLLGIISGMRTNEMCQLRLIDIKKQKNIWFIFVEDTEETKVKTENSIRKVPLHPQLIDLGFIDYMTTQKKSKRGRLFWELSEDRDGFGSHVSRHYNERFLPAVGVWKKYT